MPPNKIIVSSEILSLPDIFILLIIWDLRLVENKTTNAIWGNQSSILVGDYLLSRCFEMMVDDGDLEILKLLSSTSSTNIQRQNSLTKQHK